MANLSGIGFHIQAFSALLVYRVVLQTDCRPNVAGSKASQATSPSKLTPLYIVEVYGMAFENEQKGGWGNPFLHISDQLLVAERNLYPRGPGLLVGFQKAGRVANQRSR